MAAITALQRWVSSALSDSRALNKTCRKVNLARRKDLPFQNCQKIIAAKDSLTAAQTNMPMDFPSSTKARTRARASLCSCMASFVN